jgi:hypothetical protein
MATAGLGHVERWLAGLGYFGRADKASRGAIRPSDLPGDPVHTALSLA